MKIIYTIAVFCLALSLPVSALSAAGYSGPAPLQPQLSIDGNTFHNAIPAVVVEIDPNPPPGQVSLPARLVVSDRLETATAAFAITYVANGDTDLWGAGCTAFPEDAKAAFDAAAVIWGNLLQSSVPITIRTCWSNLGSSTTLGYSGGGPQHRNFPGAPLTNTWYGGSLANALAGSDLAPGSFDMHITYNSNFTWYYGTDGLTPPGKVDLMSVVLHEIAHGLNFAGSMSYSGGSGSWGYGTGYPFIYDTFMRDGTANPGNLLIHTGIYPNPSAALGSALRSNNIWFHGTHAMAANGGQRVKMYAPSTWRSGSSYSHLDYSTFTGGPNRLMVYAVASGIAIHDPGPVTIGIFKDMGWTTQSSTCTYGILPTSVTGSASGGSGSIAVTASAGNCLWTAVSNAAWITIASVSSGAGGAGNGAVSYLYTANTGTSSRSGTITIAASTFTLTQAPLAPVIQVTPSVLNFGSVPPGSHRDLISTVRNIGGGILTGTASTAPPFGIISGGSYSLGANQTQEVIVRFAAPLQEGLQTGSLAFTGGGGFTIQVEGRNQKAGLPWLMLLLGD